MNGVTFCKLWEKHRAKDGRQYFTGRINSTMRLLVLPNDRAGENEAPFTAFLVPIEEQPATVAANPATSQHAHRNGQSRAVWPVAQEHEPQLFES